MKFTLNHFYLLTISIALYSKIIGYISRSANSSLDLILEYMYIRLTSITPSAGGTLKPGKSTIFFTSKRTKKAEVESQVQSILLTLVKW